MICPSWLLLVALAQDGTAAPPAAASAPQAPANPLIAELAGKMSTLEQAKSYAFVIESEMSGMGGRNREGDAGGTGGGAPRPPTVVNARFQSGHPMELKQGETVAYLAGDVLVHQNAEGVWEKAERGGMRGGRSEGGGSGGPPAAPKADEAAGGAAPSKPEPGVEGRPPGGGRGPGGFGGMQSLRSVIPPHKLVEGFADKVKDVTKSDKDGKTIYTGTLTEAAASALSTMGRRNRGGGSGEGPQLTHTGSFEIALDANGAVESIRVESQASGTFGDRTIEMKRKSTYRISELGTVEVKLPEEAAKLFEV